MKSEWLQIRIQPELKDRLREMAEKDHRSMGDFVKKLIKQEAEKENK